MLLPRIKTTTFYSYIVQEVFVKKTQSGEETNKGKVVGVVTVLGESLQVEEYEFI